MTPTILTTIIAELSALIPFVLCLIRIINGMKCQLRHDMLEIYYHNKEDGIIRQYEYENFVMLYESYKALKGNSFIDKIYKEVQQWNIIT